MGSSVMDKKIVHSFGRQLRKAYPLPDDLPHPLRKALEALACTEAKAEVQQRARELDSRNARECQDHSEGIADRRRSLRADNEP